MVCSLLPPLLVEHCGCVSSPSDLTLIGWWTDVFFTDATAVVCRQFGSASGALCRVDSISERQLPWVNGGVILLGPLLCCSVCRRAPIITEDETNGLLCTGHPRFCPCSHFNLGFCTFYLLSGEMRIHWVLFIPECSERCLHLYVPPVLVFPRSTLEHKSPPPLSPSRKGRHASKTSHANAGQVERWGQFNGASSTTSSVAPEGICFSCWTPFSGCAGK